MRVQFVALTLSVLTLSVPAATATSAQEGAPPQTFLSNAQIMALVDKAKADRKNDAPLVAEPILTLAPYRAMLEYRPLQAPAALHEKDNEVMVVLDGTGNIVTGGKIVDEKRVNAANLAGPAIADGKSQTVVKGDMLVVPANTPHQVTPLGGAPIVLMTLHIPSTVPNWP